MELIKHILSLFFFLCVAALLLYVGAAVFLVALVVGLIAAIWYGIKFHFIRKELTETLREHQNTRFHGSIHRDAGEEQGTVIEGEFIEVEEAEEVDEPTKR